MPERLSDLDEVTCFVFRSPKLNSIICGCLLVDFLIVQTSDCISQLSMSDISCFTKHGDCSLFVMIDSHMMCCFVRSCTVGMSSLRCVCVCSASIIVLYIHSAIAQVQQKG